MKLTIGLSSAELRSSWNFATHLKWLMYHHFHLMPSWHNGSLHKGTTLLNLPYGSTLGGAKHVVKYTQNLKKLKNFCRDLWLTLAHLRGTIFHCKCKHISQTVVCVDTVVTYTWSLHCNIFSISFGNQHFRYYNLHPPTANLTKFQKGVYYLAIKIFNNLPHNIKDLASDILPFRNALKRFLLANSFYNSKEYLNYWRHSIEI